MKLMTFAAHVHGRGLAGGGDGSQVGIDVVLPEPKAGKDVRRHVQRVRSRGRDPGITARRGQAQFGQLRLVITVNQVVRHSGMVGSSAKSFSSTAAAFFRLANVVSPSGSDASSESA